MLIQEFVTPEILCQCRLLERLLSQVIPAPIASTLVQKWALERHLVNHFFMVGLTAGRQSKDSTVGQFRAHKLITEEKDKLLSKTGNLEIQHIIETKATLGLGLAWNILLMPALAYQN